MFTVYHSNQLDLLKTIIAELIIGKPLRDPFKPEIILVQSNEMAKWIQIELAKHFGIAANMSFSLPASFIWQMFTCVLSGIPDECEFTKSKMTWRLMSLLPNLCKKVNFADINRHLNDDNDKRKLFQFSTVVADLFDQYLVYRPEWIESWQCGKMIDDLGSAQLWQASLWKALIAETERSGQALWHLANLYQRFIHVLAQSQKRPPGLPDRVFICGITALPPIYLLIFQALGRHIDVHLLFVNPCRYYWGDVHDSAFLTRLLHRRRRHYQHQKEKELFQNPEKATMLFNALGEQKTGNPLLASWGKQGRDNLYLLAQIDDIVEVDAFVESPSNTLLSLIKRDILMLEDHTVISINNERSTKVRSKRLLQLNDRSLSFHICHSTQREVEVLQDNLLSMIAEDPSLRPRDIIVMAADIDHYASAIHAVFNNIENERYLPYSISDRRAKYLHPVLLAFLRLLELPHSRFTAEQVLSLLEVPSLAARFAIDEKGLQLIRLWVAESGIRWGLDDNMLQELMLPSTGQYTWKFGLTRMLLGYAMDSKYGDWQGILPYDKSKGLVASLVGELIELLTRLRQWRDRLAQPRSLEAWLGCAREIIEDFFIPDAEAKAALTLVENQWQKILQYGLQVGYKQSVSVTLLKNELSTRLDKELISQRFLAGAINFCTLMPMRSIPFRVVCLLGMNNGVYPRTLPPAEFNLMLQKPRRGDRSRRDDDRYLFLEAILSAQQRLYISFIGYAIHDNTPRYPSVLVSELSDYIAHSFYLAGDEHSDAESSAEHVRAHIWQQHSRMPFAPENFLPDSEFQSFADEWLPVAIGNGKPQLDFVSPLIKISYETLTLDDLLQFYHHTVRTWFVRRLAISFAQTSVNIAVDEPFIIDGLASYKLNNWLVNALIDGESVSQVFNQVRAAGLLPYGAFGEIYWSKKFQEIISLSDRVRACKLQETQDFEIFLTLEKMTLYGWLPRVQSNGLLRWRPRILSALDGLLLWVEHLAYCAMGGVGDSRMFGIHSAWHFSPMPSRQAKSFLSFLLSGYCSGMASPLLLLPRSSSVWLSQCYNPVMQNIDRDKSRQKQARNKLIQAWQGNNHIPGERKDPYLQRLIGQLEEHHIEAIMLAAEQYLLPPFIFNNTRNEAIK